MPVVSPLPAPRSGRLPAYAGRTALVAGTLALVTLTGAGVGLASIIVGSPGDDVSVGQDRDNAANPLINPPGAATRQDLDNTDVMFGRLGDDLLIGRTGSDVLIGGEGSDVLVGGPDGGGRPGADVSLGDEGDDVAVWGSGDRSETFVGDVGTDTQVVGRLARTAAGAVQVVTRHGRQVPQVSLAGGGQTCALTPVPAGQGVGEQYLLRVLQGGRLVATLRERDVERVVCSSSRPGYADVADLSRPGAAFRSVPVGTLTGLVRDLVTG